MTKKQIFKFTGATLIYWGYCYVTGYIGGKFYAKLITKMVK